MGLFDRFRKSRPIKEVTYSSREMADFLVESVPEIRERYACRHRARASDICILD